MEQVSKKRMLSGIKPTGKLTLGNYIGAIKQHLPQYNLIQCNFIINDKI